MRASIVVIAAAMLVAASGASSALSRVATPIPCGSVAGAPWTVTSHSGAVHRGNRYYVFESSNLACAAVKARVARLSWIRPTPLLRFSFTVATGERLSCLYVPPDRDIRSLRPRTAWGWCGTEVACVARLGVAAASGTEFFWATADRFRTV